MNKAPIAFRTNRFGHRYPITTGVTDLSDDGRRKRKRGEASPKVDKFEQALIAPVKMVQCPKQDRQLQAVSLFGTALRMESVEWPWKWHVCECTTPNTFGLDKLTEWVDEACQQHEIKPLLGVVAASKVTGGPAAPQLVAVVEVSRPKQVHYLRLQLASSPGESRVSHGCRIAAGTLLALGMNGAIKWCYSTNTFKFDCVDERVSPDELDLPGSGPDNVLI